MIELRWQLVATVIVLFLALLQDLIEPLVFPVCQPYTHTYTSTYIYMHIYTPGNLWRTSIPFTREGKGFRFLSSRSISMKLISLRLLFVLESCSRIWILILQCLWSFRTFLSYTRNVLVPMMTNIKRLFLALSASTLSVVSSIAAWSQGPPVFHDSGSPCYHDNRIMTPWCCRYCFFYKSNNIR